MNLLHIFYLNSENDEIKNEFIIKNLKKLNCSFTRIEKINENNLFNDEFCKKILKPNEKLIGKKICYFEYENNLENIENNIENKIIQCKEKWIYDGSIEKSFPFMSLDKKSNNMKALYMTNLKAIEKSLNMDYEWFMIIEDIHSINNLIYNKIINFLKNIKDIDFIYLYNHFNREKYKYIFPFIYKKQITKNLKLSLNPLNYNSNFLHCKYNLWNFALNYYIKNNCNFEILDIVFTKINEIKGDEKLDNKVNSKTIIFQNLAIKIILSKYLTLINYPKYNSTSNIISNNIFQTHKSQEYIDRNEILKKCQDSWKKNKKFNYHFYTDSDISDFIKLNFNEEVFNAFNLCPKQVMKADLWRYCIIYHFGGIYADADTELKTDINIFEKKAFFIGVPENNIHMCNWIFAASKKSPILKEIIDLSVKRILEFDFTKKKSDYIHFLTGPGCMTDGFESWLEKMNLPIMKNIRHMYAHYKFENLLYIYEPLNFHSKYIIHKFSGQWDDGWSTLMDE